MKDTTFKVLCIIGVVVIFAVILFLNCVFLNGEPLINLSPKIVVEPQKLDVSLSPGENFTKTISIGVIGKGDIRVTLNATEPIDGWVYFSNKSIKNKSVKNRSVEESIERDTSYVDVHFENISQDTTPGEYRGAIQIWDNDTLKAKIPVIIKIRKTMVQIVGIEAPLKVNVSEYFKITAKIKNIGDLDAFEINASANSPELYRIKNDIEIIPIIHKKEEVCADWWFKANKTEANQTAYWAIITVNLKSKNAVRDTEIIPVKIVQSK